MKDLVSNISCTLSVTPAAALTATPTTTAADQQGFNSVTAVVTHGAGGITFSGANRVDFTAEHSNDNSTFVACGIEDVILPGTLTLSGGIVRSWQAAIVAGAFDVGYVGPRRYFRLRPVFVGTHATGTFITITNVLGHPAVAPSA